MSGGRSSDPYYDKDTPKKKASKSDDPQGEMKSYRNAARPLRIETMPDGRKKYYYRCEHCKGVFHTDKRRTAKHAFHDRKCRDAWQKYGKPPRKFTKKEREEDAKRSRELWKNPGFRKKTMSAIKRATTDNPAWHEKLKKSAKEVANRPEWKKRQSEAHKGKKRPPETGRKISKAKMGHEVSDETRKKVADALKGEKSFFWRGGASSVRQRYYSSSEWTRQAERIRKRDNNTCQGCGWKQEEVNPEKALPAHHVIPLDDWDGPYEEYPDFLIVTLCPNCHAISDLQNGMIKWPLNARGDDAKPERLF